MTFLVGDSVTWSSQAAGATRTKVGRVVEVVPAKHRPKAKKKDNGMRRDHESYVVHARALRDDRKNNTPRLYWPRVSQLKLWEEEPSA